MIRLVFAHVVDTIHSIILRHKPAWTCEYVCMIWPKKEHSCFYCEKVWPKGSNNVS